MGVEWEVWKTDEFQEWFDSLDVKDAAKVEVAIDVLAEKGPSLGRELVDHVKGTDRHHNMKELRPPASTIRVLFIFDTKRRAVLLTGWDKTGTWSASYTKKIEEAEALYDEWLDTDTDD